MSDLAQLSTWIDDYNIHKDIRAKLIEKQEEV